ncbi:MAG TPA: WecB/TagA/CpsF family glycosyltransferase [Polyangiaceae bacterium]|nr:WecB/TagA/CpsF family glycosyltransferase [Polyangiaceae bacterium]
MIESVVSAIGAGERGYLCTVNVAILMLMRADRGLQRFVESARWVVADGQPLVWASRLAGTPLPERIAGVDLMDRLCARAAREGFGVYLLGGTDQSVRAAAAALARKYPRLVISGVADGYFSAREAPERARAVAASGAKLLFVGMGAPRQEGFIEQHWAGLGVNVALGVGGSFDVVSGKRWRAPELAQKLGLEWAFRAAQEPRRLLPRYVGSNSRFLWLLTREHLGRRWGRAAP